MLKSIDTIEAHLQDVSTLSEYKNSMVIIDAVERRLSIIGEALWKASKIDPELVISDKKRIISLRHIIVHDYDLINDAAIWLICKNRLPILKTEVEALLPSATND